MPRPRIMVVDDEGIVRLYVRRLVIKAMPAASVIDLASAEEAWDRIVAGEIDLLITDCNLLGASGPDLVKNIRENQIPLPVIMISGSDTNRVHGVAAGIDHFIEKRCLDRDLGPTIQSLLRDGSSRRTASPDLSDGELS